ncbi:MAG: hypothetical protein KJZ55_00740 [Flavobacteriales bacterium]|nr:hypothetical protein [Flavobacteriales bacterium]
MAYVKDKAEVERLKAEGNPANWSKIYTIYVRMNRRQELAKTLPPVGIVYEEQDFESEIENAKTKATEYAYAKGVEQLGKNDKLAAREAYSSFVESKSYITNFRDVDEKIAEAKFKGTTNVFFTIEDKSKVVASKTLMEELQAINVDDLDKDWLNYDNTIDSNRIYHYSIILSMTDILVSPEEMKESIAQESKEIEDGFSYVLDANGNVKKDTLGNDIKIPKYKTIHCAIKRVQQRKTARITGSLNYYDNITNKLMKSEPITSDALFENFYAVANGDLNALSPQSQKDLQTQPVPFPPSPDLIIQAGNVLKGMTKDIIVKNAGYLK